MKNPVGEGTPTGFGASFAKIESFCRRQFGTKVEGFGEGRAGGPAEPKAEGFGPN